MKPELIPEILKAVSWPVAVIWLGYLFRSDIKDLFKRVEQLKYKEFSAGFARELNATEDEINKIQSTTDGGLAIPSAITKLNQIYALVSSSPRAAVLEAWLLIESAATSSGLSVNPWNPSSKLPKQLLDQVNKVRELRNSVVHMPDYSVTPDLARNYIKLSFSIAEMIEQFAKKA